MFRPWGWIVWRRLTPRKLSDAIHIANFIGPLYKYGGAGYGIDASILQKNSTYFDFRNLVFALSKHTYKQQGPIS